MDESENNQERNNLQADPIGLIEYVAKGMVKSSDKVELVKVVEGSSLSMELRVAKEDVGSVIGKGGRIARAMRTLLNSISLRNIPTDDPELRHYNRLNLEIID